MGNKYRYIEGPKVPHTYNSGFKVDEDFKRSEAINQQSVDGPVGTFPMIESRVFRVEHVPTKIALLDKPLWSENKARRLATRTIKETLK